MSDLHNYKVLYGGKILSVKTAKLRLIFNKNYLPEVRCCSFIEPCVLLADLGRFSWVFFIFLSTRHRILTFVRLFGVYKCGRSMITSALQRLLAH